MSLSDPNFLNRWLDRNPIVPLTRGRYYLIIPAFSITAEWLGYSDIVGAYNYIAQNNFVLKDFDQWIPDDPTYVLCIAYANEDHTVERYRFWTAEGENIFPEIPLYNGEIIRRHFRFEIWSTSQGDAVQLIDLQPIDTSVLQNRDYRYTTDLPLVLADPLVTAFGNISASGTTPEPSLTRLEVWLNPEYGITLGTGTSVVSWADRMGHIIMQQADTGLQPTKSVAGFVRFLGSQLMLADVTVNTPITKYYVSVLSGVFGAANTNKVYNQQGNINSSSLRMNASGGMVAGVGATYFDVPFGTGRSIVEIDTSSGEIWLHSTGDGSSILVATSGFTFGDVLDLLLGGGGGGSGADQPILGEGSGENILGEGSGEQILGEGGGTGGGGAGDGFGLFEFLAYSSQTAEERDDTLRYLLGGFTLPLTWTDEATLDLNTFRCR